MSLELKIFLKISCVYVFALDLIKLLEFSEALCRLFLSESFSLTKPHFGSKRVMDLFASLFFSPGKTPGFFFCATDGATQRRPGWP
jgi:hypothetical protein